MKIDMPFAAGLMLCGTSLLARIAVQGFEPALVMTVTELGWKCLKWVKRGCF
jgi:hypothetical protein